jgi:hypothetical protein
MAAGGQVSGDEFGTTIKERLEGLLFGGVVGGAKQQPETGVGLFEELVSDLSPEHPGGTDEKDMLSQVEDLSRRTMTAK